MGIRKVSIRKIVEVTLFAQSEFALDTRIKIDIMAL